MRDLALKSVRLLRSLQGLHACGAARWTSGCGWAVGEIPILDGNIWQWLGDPMATEGEENE